MYYNFNYLKYFSYWPYYKFQSIITSHLFSILILHQLWILALNTFFAIIIISIVTLIINLFLWYILKCNLILLTIFSSIFIFLLLSFLICPRTWHYMIKNFLLLRSQFKLIKNILKFMLPSSLRKHTRLYHFTSAILKLPFKLK